MIWAVWVLFPLFAWVPLIAFSLVEMPLRAIALRNPLSLSSVCAGEISKIPTPWRVAGLPTHPSHPRTLDETVVTGDRELDEEHPHLL